MDGLIYLLGLLTLIPGWGIFMSILLLQKITPTADMGELVLLIPLGLLLSSLTEAIDSSSSGSLYGVLTPTPPSLDFQTTVRSLTIHKIVSGILALSLGLTLPPIFGGSIFMTALVTLVCFKLSPASPIRIVLYLISISLLFLGLNLLEVNPTLIVPLIGTAVFIAPNYLLNGIGSLPIGDEGLSFEQRKRKSLNLPPLSLPNPSPNPNYLSLLFYNLVAISTPGISPAMIVDLGSAKDGLASKFMTLLCSEVLIEFFSIGQLTKLNPLGKSLTGMFVTQIDTPTILAVICLTFASGMITILLGSFLKEKLVKSTLLLKGMKFTSSIIGTAFIFLSLNPLTALALLGLGIIINLEFTEPGLKGFTFLALII